MEKYDNETLETLVKEVQDAPLGAHSVVLGRIFYAIAQELLKYGKFKIKFLPTQKELAQQCVYNAMERVPNFSHKKGKVFSYFTTVMLNYLRRECQHALNMHRLEKKYKNLLKLSNLSSADSASE